MRKDGTEFAVEIGLSPVVTKDGVLTIAALRDITERIEIERRLQENERLAAVGASAAALGHEMANPLGGLLTSIDLAKRLVGTLPAADPVLREILETASVEINRMVALLKNYRDLSRPQQLALELTSCQAMIEEVLALQTHYYQRLGVAVKTRFHEQLPKIMLDRDKIKQAILNLCQNAVEAMPDGGTLTLRTPRAKDRAVIEVQDTGTGIAKDLDIFKAFTTTKKEGMGLGLSIVRQIVSAHSGTIDYVSEIGKGTTFRIALPLAHSAAVQRS